jgi:acyl transferase domain-containing protein
MFMCLNEQQITNWLSWTLAKILGVMPFEVDLDLSLRDLGLSTADAKHLADAFERWSGSAVATEVIYNAAPARFLVDQLTTTKASSIDHFRTWQLLILSDDDESKFKQTSVNLARYLRTYCRSSLADVAYILQFNAREGPLRNAVVCKTHDEAVAKFDPATNTQRVLSLPKSPGGCVFMFPGVGEHYPNMARGLYEEEPTFRQHMDHCNRLLTEEYGFDLIKFLYSGADPGKEGANSRRIDLLAMLDNQEDSNFATDEINQTAAIQPALFVVEYALAQTLRQWGVHPTALIGYSVGEYVAACLAGVMSWQDTLRLVVERARIVQDLPCGGMLAIGLSEEEVRPHLSADVCLAGVNGPSACVLSGTSDALKGVVQLLVRQKCAFRWLATSHAFHSRMLAPAAEQFTDVVDKIQLHLPQIPYISNVTGDWITVEQSCDSHYWARHMCEPVRFYRGLQRMMEKDDQVFLEIGPGNSLGSLAKQYSNRVRRSRSDIFQILRTKYETQDDVKFLLQAMANMWLRGVSVDWAGFCCNDSPNDLSGIASGGFGGTHVLRQLRAGATAIGSHNESVSERAS